VIEEIIATERAFSKGIHPIEEGGSRPNEQQIAIHLNRSPFSGPTSIIIDNSL
jgi:hypothetical protein